MGYKTRSVFLYIVIQSSLFSIGNIGGFSSMINNSTKAIKSITESFYEKITGINLKERFTNAALLAIESLTKIASENNFLHNTITKNILEHKKAIFITTTALTTFLIAKKIYNNIHVKDVEEDIEKKSIFNLLFEDILNNNQQAHRLIEKNYNQQNGVFNYKILLSQPIFGSLTEEQKIMAKILNNEVYNEQEEEDFMIWSTCIHNEYL